MKLIYFLPCNLTAKYSKYASTTKGTVYMLVLKERVIKWSHLVILGSHSGQAYFNSPPRRKGECCCRLSNKFSVSEEGQNKLREED